MKDSKPSNWKCCATCRKWGGTRKPNISLTFVEFDTNDKGPCYNGALSHNNPTAQFQCVNWQPQYTK